MVRSVGLLLVLFVGFFFVYLLILDATRCSFWKISCFMEGLAEKQCLPVVYPGTPAAKAAQSLVPTNLWCHFPSNGLQWFFFFLMTLLRYQVVFNIFTKLDSYYHCLFPEHFHHPPKKSRMDLQSHPSAWQPLIYLLFGCSRHFLWMEPYTTGASLTPRVCEVHPCCSTQWDFIPFYS